MSCQTMEAPDGPSEDAEEEVEGGDVGSKKAKKKKRYGARNRC